MAAPKDRTYLPSHEWHKPEGDLVVVGISQFAVDELTDITYLEVITREGHVTAGQTIGEIESVKATSELYTGIAGEVVAVNEALLENPALINEDPYEAGWILKIRPSDPAQVQTLLAAPDYDAQNAH